MYQVLQADMIREGNIHRYDGVPTDTAVQKRCSRLSKAHWRHPRSSWSMPVGLIASNRPSPTWYTAAANNRNANQYDVAMLRACRDDFTTIRKAWLGCLVDISHKLVIRRKDAPLLDGGAQQWYICGEHATGSCVTVWPCTRVVLPDTNQSYMVLDQVMHPQFIAITDLSLWEAAPLVWKSWMSQVLLHPDVAKTLPPGVRPFFGDQPRPLIETAARHAFWDLSTTKVKEIAKHHQWHAEDGLDDIQYLFFVIKQATGLPDEEVLRIVALKWNSVELKTEFASALLAIDEVVSVLDYHDHRVLVDEQRDAERAIDTKSAFYGAYKKLREEIRAKLPDKKKAKHGHPAKLPFEVPHADVAKYAPPGTSVWRSVTRNRG